MNLNPYQSPQTVAAPAAPRRQISRPLWLVGASVAAMAAGLVSSLAGTFITLEYGRSWAASACRLGGMGLIGLGTMFLVMALIEHQRRGWK